MNHTMKRWLCAVLCLAMCLGLLPGVSIRVSAAEVKYVVKEDVILNWGSRGTVATFLSPNAESFYEDYHITYEELALLSGSSDVAGVPESELYQVLQELMASYHTHETKYDETRPLYRYTDCQGSDDSSISSFYSGVSIGPEWDGGATWNREHTWPNSKGLAGNDENDIMMLRPTSVSENSSRGNKAYGESAGYYDPNEKSGGIYNLHGDVARIMLYTYVRWGNTELMWGTDGVMESKEVLLKWMKEDPVDTWELGRNDSVESITGTRNVFVDYPELAFLLLGQTVPADMITPSGEASAEEDYVITSFASDPSMGQILMDGRVITAEAKDGYRIAGFTVVSGEAVVTQKGNVFTVYPLSDCTVRIDFKAIELAEVTFMENGTAAATETVYAGDTVTMPAHSGEVPEGCSFMGWVAGEVSQTAEIPAELYPVGSSMVAEEKMTVYALYSRLDKAAEGTGKVFEPFSGSIEEGDYLIVSDDAAMKAEETSKPRLNYSEITYSNDTIENPPELLIWHIAPTADGYYTIYNEAAGQYAAGTGTKSEAELIASVSDASKWSVSEENAGYDFVNLANANEGVNANLRKNGTYGFACYSKNTNYSLMSLYKRASGVVYYSTSIEQPVVVIGPGDIDLDGDVDVDDVLALLWHVLFPEDYPIEVDADFDGNGATDVDDVLTLLWHVLFPEDYPLN